MKNKKSIVILNLIQNLSFIYKNDRFRFKHGMTNGFTLAEVLITLGVIGVVAAITMPVLIKNYQKTVWVNQLKKSVNIVENGFKMAMADDEVMELENTRLFQSMGNGTTMNNTNFDNFMTEFKKYFKVIGTKYYGNTSAGYKLLSGMTAEDFGESFDGSTIYLNDGTILFVELRAIPSKVTSAECEKIKSLGGTMCSYIGNFNIDVNGKKGPNQFGRDRFWFYLGNNGRLYPNYGKDIALYWDSGSTELANSQNYWKNNNNQYCDLDAPFYSGFFGCAARIIENGWRMDY